MSELDRAVADFSGVVGDMALLLLVAAIIVLTPFSYLAAYVLWRIYRDDPGAGRVPDKPPLHLPRWFLAVVLLGTRSTESGSRSPLLLMVARVVTLKAYAMTVFAVLALVALMGWERIPYTGHLGASAVVALGLGPVLKLRTILPLWLRRNGHRTASIVQAGD